MYIGATGHHRRTPMAIDEVMLDIEEKMETAIDYLRKEFRGIRTGRASIGLVEHIKVDYYGSPTDLRQLATISTPDATMIIIKPFDPSCLKDIEKAIYVSGIGITPMADGKLIRLTVPPLSTERRNQIAGQLKKMAEAARVTVRNARRDGNKEVDRQEKAAEMTEDDARKAKDQIQKMTDDYEKKVTDNLDAKTMEIQES
jgi:ribosome recycling factor